MIMNRFHEDILAGIPSILPEPKPYDTTVNHAPKRKEILRLKILRLVPCQWIERIILIRGYKPRSLRCHAKLRRDWATRKQTHQLG